MKKDYYSTLGVAKGASSDDIKKAFRKLAHQHHPDKEGGDEKKFKEANEAYQVLSDPEKRKKYDQFGADYDKYANHGGHSWEDFARQSGFGFSGGAEFDLNDLGDMVGEMFGFGGRRRAGRASHGSHLQIELTIEFREAAFGVKKDIRITHQVVCARCAGNGAEPGTRIVSCATCKGAGQVVTLKQTFLGSMQAAAPCSACHASGKTAEKPCKECKGVGAVRKEEAVSVHVPAGIDHGETIRLQGQGDAGPSGALPGDLYITLRVRPDAAFERDGADLYKRVPIRISESVLGATVAVETLDGKVDMKVPPGTISGTKFRLAHLGVPYLNRSGRGNLIVSVDVVPPKTLSKKQRDLLEQLKKEGI
ncbi:molecular chaperone DnaJ [Candidatus Uhrbacteria bacterium]|nr:molecular chaperone DnaJ [Candidatus Uhrbacteria bacterium]